MRSAVYYAKVSVLFLALFLESYFLSQVIFDFIKSQQFFTPVLNVYGIIVLLEMLLIITNALMIGAWGKWEQFVFTPVPIITGMLLVILPINKAYSIIFILLAYLLICYDMLLASQLKSQMLVFNPRLVLKFTSKAISLIFSLLSAILIILNAQNHPELNIGNKIGEIFDKYFMPKISYQIDTKVDEVTKDQKQKLSAFGLDPGQVEIAEKSGLFSSVVNSQLSLKDTITEEVNGLIEPYK